MALAGGTPDSVESLLDLYLRSVGLGSNLILNFPPTTTGQIALMGMQTPPKQMVPLMLLAARGWYCCSSSMASKIVRE